MIVALYCDGGCIQRNPSPIGITWAWCAVDEDDRRVLAGSGVIPVVSRPLTNNVAEQCAIVKALEAMPDGWSGLVCSDSQIALGRVFLGWRESGLPRNVSERTRAAVARLGVLKFELLQGHPTKKDLEKGIGAKRGFRVSPHQVFCDSECRREANVFLSRLAARQE